MTTGVYANESEVCSKTANGTCTVVGDPCWSPPSPAAGPILIMYPNTAKAKNLKSGSTSVFIKKKPIALKDVSYMENSTGNEAATMMFAKGLATSVIKGKAFFTNWSPDVKVESLNVCRHQDPTTHNHR